MSHKLGICIPYRNRKEHIERLIPHLSKYLTSQNIDHKFYVGHQVDDKLFNRGAMKNIAAHYAFNDGCDYIAWHDVDMLVYDKDGVFADYSYPEDNPMHIATKLSKYNYGLGYDQYFGGVVLFTKEQAYQTNGYSNDYWDWGQEDDDLFWRCYFEGLTTGKIIQKYESKKYAKFNGKTSAVEIPTSREISSCFTSDHTISILFNAEQQQDVVPIWLVGDQQNRFLEYPILRKEGMWTWGVSFNNSRAVSMVVFDRNSQHHYFWAKRFENLWTWVTISYSQEENKLYLYINDELERNVRGIREKLPFDAKYEIARMDAVKPFVLGNCPHQRTYYKGKIGEVKIFKKCIKPDEINQVFTTTEDEDLVLHYDFEDGFTNKVNGSMAVVKDSIIGEEDIEIVKNVLPFRKEGQFYCLPHIDEGFVNGRWAKGETTARNEKRFVTEMQQKKINYRDEGLNKITEVTEVVETDETLYPNTMFINTKMK
jgi:hypothetical protein